MSKKKDFSRISTAAFAEKYLAGHERNSLVSELLWKAGQSKGNFKESIKSPNFNNGSSLVAAQERARRAKSRLRIWKIPICWRRYTAWWM